MATGPNRSGGGSTIAAPVGSQTKPTITQGALVALRRIFFTAQDLSDPERLYQVLYQQGQAVAAALRELALDPVGGGNLLTGNVFTAGQTLYLQHGLGRAYRGWWCTRAQSHVASLLEVALPSGVSSAQTLPIQSANAGTYDLYVF